MKKIKYENVKNVRLKKNMTCKEMVDLLNPIREKRGAKPITAGTYYRKEMGDIPVYIEEAEEIASVLGKNYKIFFNQ